MDQVAKFRAKMISLQHSETAKKGWIEQGLKLNHVCIHKYRCVNLYVYLKAFNICVT